MLILIFENLFDYSLRFIYIFDIFDTLFIITLFLLVSLLVYLLTLRLSINIKHLCLFFHSLPILMNILKYRTPFPRLLNLTNTSNPSVHFDSSPPAPFIRHLRLREEFTFCWKIFLVTLSKNLVATLTELLSLFVTVIINIYIQWYIRYLPELKFTPMTLYFFSTK